MLACEGVACAIHEVRVGGPAAAKPILMVCSVWLLLQVATFVRQIVGTYGTIDYVEVVATARGFTPLRDSIARWGKSWRKKTNRKLRLTQQSGTSASDSASPQLHAALRETLQHQFQALDPECTGLLRVKSFRRSLAHLDFTVKGKAWDALLSMVADSRAGGQNFVVCYPDATDLLTGRVDAMASGRRKIRMALARFRSDGHAGALGRVFPHGTASSVSEVVTRLGLSVQPVASADQGVLNVRQLARLGSTRPADAPTARRWPEAGGVKHVLAVDDGDDERSAAPLSEAAEGSYAGLNLGQQLQQLQKLKLLRARRKRAIAESLLQQSNTAHLFLFPSFGAPAFFEFTVTNVFSSSETVQVDIDDPLKEGALRLVMGAAEWYAHRSSAHRRFGRRFPGRVEEDMFGPNRETQLGPNESVQIPLVFCSMRVPDESLPSGSLADQRVVSVSFRSTQRQVELARLDVHVVPQGVVINRTVRLFPQEQDVNRTCLRVLKAAAAPSALGAAPALTSDFAVECSSTDVVVERASVPTAEERAMNWHSGPRERAAPPLLVSELQHQDICLRYRCKSFPAVHSFLVVLYTDVHKTDVFCIFRVVLHSAHRLGVSAALGEDVKLELVCRPSRWPRHGRHRNHESCQLHSSHANEVAFAPSGEFKMDMLAHASTVLLKYQPRTAPPGSTSDIIVTLVNRDLREILALWNLRATVGVPHITQEVSIHVSQISASARLFLRSRCLAACCC